MARPEVTGRKPHATAAGGDAATVPVACYSIKSFCKAHGISQELYFKLKRLGKGPRTMAVGARTLISLEAAADWRHSAADGPDCHG